ncbi:hypothetical protein RhiJN_11484 [Ceratobasidium sp. AG-Ba]|nr:hypothetical protein RhiJN_11484 [Ceratobasidium sp. AG-Ba]
MQLTVAAVFLAAAASLTSAQTVPGSAPGCVKYCLRIAREQTPSACTWAGWCNTPGFQDSVSNCYNNICGPTNQQVGAQIYQQICSSAGSSTECPTSGAPTATSSAASASSSSASETSTSASATTSDLITTTIGGVATTFPASYSSSIAAELSSSAAGASSSAASVSQSISSAVSSATAPVSSAISSLLGSASSVAASASSAAASSTSSAANAATAVNLPTHGQVASIGALLLGVVAGALML